MWCEAEARVICPPALCATAALRDRAEPQHWSPHAEGPQDLLADHLGHGDEHCRAVCLARGPQGASLTWGWGCLPRPGRFWRAGTLHAPRRRICRSSSSWEGDVASRVMVLGCPAAWGEGREATAAGRGALWDGMVSVPLSRPRGPAAGGRAHSPLFLGTPQCWQWLSSLLRPQARYPQPVHCPPPCLTSPLPSPSPPLLPPAPALGSSTSRGFRPPSSPRSVSQSPSLGLALTNHPINPILLILLDP